MNESTFVEHNKQKWLLYEQRLKHRLSTDALSEMYAEVGADLSYAQSNFADAYVTLYLNNLQRKLHDKIYRSRHLSFSDFVNFFTKDIPSCVADAHFEMKLSFFVFLFFVAIGVVLAIQDIQNVIDTLGVGYVDMTLENIRNGVPTDVYGNSEQQDMFSFIVINNLIIDVKTYYYGFIPIIGTGYILWNNGIMLGEFQTLFFLNDVGFESMTAIWIHGTIEISTIIICGAASLALGLGWVMPGTYSRVESLKRSGMRSIRIFVSILPLTILAAFLEAFVTRHTEYPLFVKLTIIGLSLAFILFYYVYLPHKIRKRQK